MSKGLCWTNYGTGCLERLAVSIGSAQRLAGHLPRCMIHFYDVELEPEVVELAERLETPLVTRQVGEAGSGQSLSVRGQALAVRGKNRVFILRILAIELFPFEQSLYLDADTLIVQGIDDVFARVEPGIHFTGFDTRRRVDRAVRGRLTQWRGLGLPGVQSLDLVLKSEDIPAVNGGVYLVNGGKSVPEIIQRSVKGWVELALVGARKKVFIADEIAAQILIGSSARNFHFVDQLGFNTSVALDKLEPHTRIIHYHGGKHRRANSMGDYWKSAREMVTPEVEELLQRVQRVKERERERVAESRRAERSSWAPDVVTAVTHDYVKRFAETFPTWVESGLLGASHLRIITTEPDLVRDRIAEIIGDARPYTLHHWRGIDPLPVGPHGETKLQILCAFVLFAPLIAATSHWVKLDCDVRVEKDKRPRLFEDKRWHRAALVSSPWGYTKPANYILRMDEWAVASGLLKQEDVPERNLTPEATIYSHSRIISFACLHQTAWSRDAAAFAWRHGLPVPSHDTYFHYYATATGATIKTPRVKQWGIRQ